MPRARLESIVMNGIRRHLTWLLFVWLACQMSALAAPIVLAAVGSAPVEELCTCTGVDHDTCPMHHRTAADSAQSQVCEMSSCCAPVDVAFLSMAGGAGVLPAALHMGPPLASSLLATCETSFHGVVPPHDTPPPRS